MQRCARIQQSSAPETHVYDYKHIIILLILAVSFSTPPRLFVGGCHWTNDHIMHSAHCVCPPILTVLVHWIQHSWCTLSIHRTMNLRLSMQCESLAVTPTIIQRHVGSLAEVNVC